MMNKSAHWQSHLHYLINWENVRNAHLLFAQYRGLYLELRTAGLAGARGFGPAEQQLRGPDGWKKEFKS